MRNRSQSEHQVGVVVLTHASPAPEQTNIKHVKVFDNNNYTVCRTIPLIVRCRRSQTKGDWKFMLRPLRVLPAIREKH